MQRTPALILFLLIRLHRNIQIGLAESRHRPQNLLPRCRPQNIDGSSPFRQPLHGGEFSFRNPLRCSTVHRRPDHQRHDRRRSSYKRPYSPLPRALRSTRCLGRGKHLRSEIHWRLRSRQCGLQELVLPFLACVFHFITSNRSFRAVCNRDLTVPAGIPSTTPTSPASISSTSESCKALRSFSGKRSISFRSRSNCTCCSASFAPSNIARVSVICHAVSRVSRRRWLLCRFNASRKTIRFTHPRNFSASRSDPKFW